MIAILLHDTLQAIAIKQLARHMDGNVVIARDADHLITRLSNDANLIITDALHFIARLRWFMPRRDHVVIADVLPRENIDINSDGPAWLCLPCSQSELLQQLNDLINMRHMDQHSDAAPPPEVLSKRELDVLRLVASGMINKEIAASLNVSINTVLTHRKHITAKLRLKSIADLSRYALMNGLI